MVPGYRVGTASGQREHEYAITPERLTGVLSENGLAAWAGPRTLAPEFPLEWALKDVDLAIGAAGDDELPLLAALSRQWRAAVDAGHGREDISAARLALGGQQ
jgi:3-hydroxyisobutyrate dehydrogenase